MSSPCTDLALMKSSSPSLSPRLCRRQQNLPAVTRRHYLWSGADSSSCRGYGKGGVGALGIVIVRARLIRRSLRPGQRRVIPGPSDEGEPPLLPDIAPRRGQDLAGHFRGIGHSKRVDQTDQGRSQGTGEASIGLQAAVLGSAPLRAHRRCSCRSWPRLPIRWPLLDTPAQGVG